MLPSSDNAATRFSTELLSRRWLSHHVFEMELARPESFTFTAGQTIAFLHESIKRHYSLVSGPAESTLTLCVQRIKEGVFSNILAAAEIGARFHISGPHGYFTFKPSQRRAVFVATGTGIAPFVSVARTGVTGFTLFHEVEFEKELFYQSELRDAALEYYACLTKISEDKRLCSNLFCGKAADCIKKYLTKASYDFYLCGNEKMIKEVTLLVDENYPKSFIYTEVFF
jgi:benzoate/toluate 1,2-dioxygenase reductase component